MARVFVSHASQDLALAERMYRWLLDDGHQVFLDRSMTDGIVPGDEWERRLHERLRWADAVACVVTSAFVRSPWCTGEVAVARSRGCRLIPLQAEPATTHPLLGAVQHIDCRHGPDAVRAALTEALRLIDAAGGVGWPDGRSPFPGLRAFAADQHQVFFGRAAEVNELGGLLRSPAERADAAVLLVVGPSGCGKSSLARAGLLPAMAGEPGWWTLPPMLPGTDPEAALVREFAAGFRAVGVETGIAELRSRLDSQGLTTVVDELLHAAPGPRRQRLLLVIDQFEELLTQTDPDRRARFADLLRPLASGPLRVVGTLRPEFLDPLLVCPELAGLSTRTYTVRPLGRDALPSVIEDPARLAGIGVDDDLVARLVADTDDGAALPLLAYTLAQLAEGVGRGGRLQLARYEQLGGVQGTLARQADAALAAAETASGRSREDVLRDLLRLVTVDEHGRPTRWRVPAAELPAAELEPFVMRRLLITEKDGDDVVVKVAHEAILSAWAPLREAIEADTAALRARRGIELAAQEWATTKRPSVRLWERGQLAAALADTGAQWQRPPDSSRWSARRRVLASERVALSPRAREFLEAGVRRDRRRRRRSTTILTLLLVVALAAAGVAVTQLGAAEQRQRLATARLLIAQAETAASTNPRAALRLAEAAQQIQPGPETRSFLAQVVSNTRYAGVLDQGDPVRAVQFSPDGNTIAIGGRDGTVALWDAAGRRRIGATRAGQGSAVNAVAFTPDGGTLAVGGIDGTVSLWDVTDPARPYSVDDGAIRHAGAVTAVAFAPGGRLLATGSVDRTVALWDLRDRNHPRPRGTPLLGHTDVVSAVAFSPSSETLATGGGDVTILWDLTDRDRPRARGKPLTGHTVAVNSVTFAPDGLLLATGSFDSTVLLWDLTDPASPQRVGEPLQDTSSTVYAAFGPSGRTLAMAGSNKTIILWDVSDPTRPGRIGEPLIGHGSSVNAVTYAPDGRTLATGGYDGTVILWDLTGADQPRLLGAPPGQTGVATVALFSPDGRHLAAGSSEGQVQMWDVTDVATPRLTGTPFGHDGRVNDLAFSPDGRTLAVAGDDGAVVLWDLSDIAAARPVGEPLIHPGRVNQVAYSPNSKTLATVSDTALQLWDVTAPDRLPRAAARIEQDTYDGSVAFSPDGRTLAAASESGTATLWDLTDTAVPRPIGEPLEHGGNVLALAFTPDGRTLAASSDTTITMWDVTDLPHPRRIAEPLTGHRNRVVAVAFSPDGQMLATSSEDNAFFLWDLSDRARPRRLGEPVVQSSSVKTVAFSPDGQTLATTSLDADLWDLRPPNRLRQDPLERACAKSGGGLDADEWAVSVPGLDYLDSCGA